VVDSDQSALVKIAVGCELDGSSEKKQLPTNFGAVLDLKPGLCNAVPILNEIRLGLDRLLNDGDDTVIDLQRIPLSVDDEIHLREALGEGEVCAKIDTLGASTVQESGIAGVWWIIHHDEFGAVMGKFIEVTTVPELLKSQREDIARGRHELITSLETGNPSSPLQE
jgi:hydrogenase-1 operon protein HyaF